MVKTVFSNLMTRAKRFFQEFSKLFPNSVFQLTAYVLQRGGVFAGKTLVEKYKIYDFQLPQ